MLYRMQNDEFEKVFEIMVDAFPIDERRTFDEQIALLDNPLFEISVCKDSPSGEIKGFISTYSFSKFCFAEHFAVDSKYRNMGLGHEILSELATLRTRILLEVEPPITEQAKRRIAFYERNGFCLNEYQYTQPPISKHTKPIPLMIMTTDGALSEAQFLEAKATLYENVYGVERDAY